MYPVVEWLLSRSSDQCALRLALRGSQINVTERAGAIDARDHEFTNPLINLPATSRPRQGQSFASASMH